MIDHGDFIERLISQCPDFEGRVYDFAQYHRDEPAFTMPCAYLYLAGDRASDEYGTLDPRQVMHPTVAVVLVVSATGVDTQDFSTLAALRESVRSALRGWIPDGCFDTVQFLGGQPEELYAASNKDGVPAILVWEDRYTTQYLTS